MSGLIETPAQIWVAVAPVDMRLVGHRPAKLGAFALRRLCVYLP